MKQPETLSPLPELGQIIYDRACEAREKAAIHHENKNYHGAVAYTRVASALVELGNEVSRMQAKAEKASVEKPLTAVRCGAWVGAQAWTIDKPRASGVWWWWKGNPAHKPELVKITAEPWMEGMGLGPIMQWPGLTRTRNVFLVGGVWAGPVEPLETPSAATPPNGELRDDDERAAHKSEL